MYYMSTWILPVIVSSVSGFGGFIGFGRYRVLLHGCYRVLAGFHRVECLQFLRTGFWFPF